MAAPIFIAVNQTGTAIDLVQLGLTVPASGQVTLSDYNTTSQIQDDPQLKDEITANRILINDGTITLAKAASAQYVSGVAATAPLVNVEAGADVTDWGNVSTSLGGQAGAVANLVFKSNGSGGGSMVKNTQVVARRVTVGLSGDVDYTSVATAVSAAISGGANVTTPWEVLLAPGTYTEAPMTVPVGVTVSAAVGEKADTVFIVASNAVADLFTMTGGALIGLRLSGVTDSAKCLIRAGTAGTLTGLTNISIKTCSNGIIVENGAALVVNGLVATVIAAASAIGTVFTATGAGTQAAINGGSFVVPAAVLPAYSTNPIQTCVRVASAAYAVVNNVNFLVDHKDTTADVFLLDGGSLALVQTCAFNGCCNAIHIGASGSDTKAILQAVNFIDCEFNIYTQSATGVVFANFATDIQRKSLVAGAKLLGLIQYRDAEETKLIGDIQYRYLTDKDVDLADFFASAISTGVQSGGVVTAGTGLAVNVAAGTGWVSRGTPDFDAFSVSWSAANAVALTASSTNYVYYDSVNATITTGLSEPGASGILLAAVVTSGSGIRFLHRTRTPVSNQAGAYHQYLLSTRKLALQTGLATTQGSTIVKFAVASGEYYLANDLISYAGTGGDATWSYFYGSNGATEVASQTSLNTTQYDNAGTLTSMTASYYRADTVVVSSDGRVSVMYGTSEYATKALAESAAVATTPTFIAVSAFPVALIVVQQGVGIASIVDIRVVPGASSGGGSGTSSHSALSDLDKPADHAWAMLVNGTRAMTGNLNMGTQNVTNVGTVDGVDVSGHAARHNPGGLDAVTTATPTAVSVGAAAAEGSAGSLARSDHQHGIAAGTPVSVGTANAAGTSSNVARADHVHAGLSRLAGDYSTFTQKAVPVGADVLLIEDSAAAGAKKWINVSAIAGEFNDGGDVAGANRTLGNTDAYSLGFVTSGVTRLSISATGVVSIPGKILAGAGPDFSLQYVSSGQTAMSSFYGLQLVGNRQSTVDYAPTNMGTAGAYGIAVPSQQAGAIALGVRAASGQTGALQTWESNAGVALVTVTAGGNITFSSTQTVDGRDLSVDGSKLDGIAAGATNTPLSSTAPVTVTKGAASAGVASEASRQDHKHDVSTAVAGAVAAGGTAAEGTAASLARSDHAHSVATAAPVNVTKSAAVDGVATSFSRSDHKHDVSTDTPVNVTKAAAAEGVATALARSDHKHDVSTSTAVANPPGTSNAEGTSTSLARADHTHALPAYGSTTSTICQGDDARLSNDRVASGLRTATTVVAVNTAAAPTTGQVLTATSGTAANWQTPIALTAAAPSDVTKAAAVVGVATTAARADHKHDISTAAPADVTKAAAVEGTATSLARSDHKHDVSTGTPVNVTKATAAEGTATSLARSDHKHDVTTAVPSTIGTVVAEGTSTSLARADHVHAHGAQTDGTLHATATGAVAGFLGSADKAKIDAISNNTLAGGYAYFAIWAEENAVLSAATYEWSFGAGGSSTVSGGIQIPFDCELYALALDCNGTSSTASVRAERDGSSVATVSVTAQVRNYTVLGSPVAFTAGQRINFYTVTATASSTTGNKITAFFRTPLALTVPGAAQGDVLYYSGTGWARLPAGTSGRYLQTLGAGANPQWAAVAGTGDVVGPGSSTDNAVARFDLATGKLIQNSGVLIDDSNNISGAGTINSVNIATHASRHNPGGSDAVTTAAAANIGTSNTEGTATSLARSDHGHALPFSVVQTVLGTASSAIGVNSQRLTSVADPTSAQDAATKAYVDALVQGLSPKAAALAMSVTNVATLSGLAQTVDGVALNTIGQRTLLVGQGTATQNGLWVVQSGAWTRPLDFAAGSRAASAYVFVTSGTNYADSGWVCTTDPPGDVVDTNSLTWAQFSGAGQITAGAGLTKTGNTIAVGANIDGSVTVNSDDIQIGVLANDTQHGTRGGGTVHAAATTSVNGFMSSGDKTKLDSISSNAAALTSSAPENVTKAAASVGVGTTAARSDHKHDVTTATAIAIGTANAEGSSTSLARADHTHQVTGLTITSQVQGDVLYYNGTAWVRLAPGTSGQYLRTQGAAANPQWATVTGTGDVVGPGSATDNALVRFDATTGKLVQNSVVTVADNGDLSVPATGSTLVAPRTVGITNLADGEGGRFLFGDTANGWQNGFNQAMQMWAYHTIVLEGNRSLGTAPTMELTSDINVLVRNIDAASPALVVAGASAQTANLQQWRSSAGTVLVSVDASGNIAFSGTQTVDGVDVSGHAARHNAGGADAMAIDAVAGTGSLRTLGTAATAACAGNDSRLANDRTASGLRTATTTVSISGATAPSSGQALVATSTTNATWQSVATLASTAPADVTKATAAVGVGTTAARADHKHDISTAAPSNVTKAAAAEGTATSLARSDHKHDINTAAASTLSGSNAEGSATSLARSDHNHALGGTVGGDLSGTLPNPTVTDLTITSEAQGAILYRNATNWVVLPPGTAGQQLQTNGAGANPTWAAASGSGVFTFPIGICDTLALDVEPNDAVWGSLVIPVGAITITKMQCQVTQAAAGTVYFAIYDASFNKLGDETTGVSCATTGIKQGTLISGVALTAGTVYYFCIRSTANGSRFAGRNSTSSTATPQYSIRKDSVAAASFPASFVTPAANTATLWVAGFA